MTDQRAVVSFFAVGCSAPADTEEAVVLVELGLVEDGRRPADRRIGGRARHHGHLGLAAICSACVCQHNPFVIVRDPVAPRARPASTGAGSGSGARGSADAVVPSVLVTGLNSIT